MIGLALAFSLKFVPRDRLYRIVFWKARCKLFLRFKMQICLSSGRTIPCCCCYKKLDVFDAICVNHVSPSKLLSLQMGGDHIELLVLDYNGNVY